VPDAQDEASGEPAGEAAAVAVFTALADPTRRHILDSLARQGPATVSDLADRLPITRQAVAKHLAQLVEAGLLVAGEPQGRRVPYRLRPEPVRAALAWLTALANSWDDRLGALAAHLDASLAPAGSAVGSGDAERGPGPQTR
jgi:DNA-binding transcriptional ArsR family regulator